jgi:hypothetical protein
VASLPKLWPVDRMDAPPEEALAVQQTVVHIRARVAAAGAFRESVVPVPGSPIATDYADGHGLDLVTHGLSWMLSADGHLLTLAAAFSTGELQAYGPYSLLRGAAEPLARLTWLFDDSATSRERHQRLLGERLENQVEVRKLKAARKQAEERIEHIAKRAAAAGFTSTPATGRPNHFGQPRPSATVLFAQLLAEVDEDPDDTPLGELLYRLLSGHAHSAMYALMSQADLSGAREGQVNWARIELNLFHFLSLVHLVLTMYDVAQARWCRMHGLEDGDWRAVLVGLPPTADLRSLQPASGSLGL